MFVTESDFPIRVQKESLFAVANELFEQNGNRRVKINLTIGIRGFEPLFDLPATSLLFDAKCQEIGRNPLIDFDPLCLSDS